MSRTLEYDVVIVGSGPGGGVVADRLSNLCGHGARIALLDAGAWYSRESFNMLETDMAKLFMKPGVVPSKNFQIMLSAGWCVGGGSTVYTGVTFRAPDGLIAKWSRDFGLDELDEQDIQDRFPRIEQEINAEIPGPDLENANNRIFRQGCEKLGWPVRKFRVNIKDCEKCGFCNLGCPYGSKKGTLEVQIPRAMDRGVELIPNCRITRVWDGGAEGEIKPAPAGSKPGSLAPGPASFRAKKIVLAAGSLGSPAILLNSNLPDLSPACGHYLSIHPAMTAFGLMPEPVLGFEGFPKIYYTDKFSKSNNYYLETAFYFPFVTAKAIPGFGTEVKRIMKHYKNLACTLVLLHDETLRENHVYLENGMPAYDYTLSQSSRDSLVHALRNVGRMYFAAGAREYISPVCRHGAIRNPAALETEISAQDFEGKTGVVSSAHPQGGCRMGRDPETSVTDEWGRVHGHPDIVVADASLFPSSTKVNPYLTIMALADRIAERLKKEIG